MVGPINADLKGENGHNDMEYVSKKTNIFLLKH